MNENKYYELLDKLNFYDFSVGVFPITLYDTKEIEEILKEFNYISIGLKNKKRKDRYYKFTDGMKNYKIIDFENQLMIVGI